MSDPHEQIREFLQAHGVTPTSQRLEVAQILFARPQHLSADQILAAVRATGSHVSKATVYNTLNLFVEKGLVREVNVEPSRLYYDSTTVPHHHIFNVDTGELTDIEPDAIGFSSLPQLPEGTETDGVHVVIRVRNKR